MAGVVKLFPYHIVTVQDGASYLENGSHTLEVALGVLRGRHREKRMPGGVRLNERNTEVLEKYDLEVQALRRDRKSVV